MTIREIVIQAHMELGKSREEAERSAKASDAAFPGARLLTYIPVKSSAARELIDAMKQVFQKLDTNPKLRESVLNELHKHAKHN